jgi:multiple sugar transport system ATP-binding protein
VSERFNRSVNFMATVTLDSVSKIHPSKAGPVHAVRTVSFGIADREMVVLVGPSGCGKTTTLRLIAGLEDASEGTIRIGDRVVNNVAPKDRDIAMVFQNYALYPHMTVYENMAFGLKMRKTPRAEIKRKVDEAADWLGIRALLDRKPKQLSGGERQRVAVGRAIVRHPQVFLFDEPLSNLDAKLRVQMRTEIKRLQRRLATTAVYVTHDQEEAMTLADRLVVMKKGVIQQIGTPLDVYNRPANLFVAGFFGTPSMNFLTGRVDVSGAELRFEGAGATVRLPDAWKAALRSGSAAVLGVRAEHVAVNGGGRRDDTAVGQVPAGKMRVETIEPLGDSQNIHLHTSTESPLVARVAPTVAVKVGETVSVAFDPQHLHLFTDDEAGARLA